MGELIVAILAMTGIVFGASAASKLRSRLAFRSFSAGLRETDLISARRLPAIAVTLACGEAVVAILLAAAAILVWAGGGVVLGVVALVAAALLTAMLVIGVALVMRRGVSARCACFGAASDEPLGRVHLARNLTLLAIEVIGIALSPLAGPPAAAGGAVALLAALTAALIVVRWEDIAALIAPLPPMSGAGAPPKARSR